MRNSERSSSAPPARRPGRCISSRSTGSGCCWSAACSRAGASESIERNRNFPFDPKQIDAVVLSHAHIDHCGNLPNLCRQGFEGNIYCTFATRDLASIMLEDSAEIQRDDAAFVSKKRAKQGLPPVEPLYTRHGCREGGPPVRRHQLRPPVPGGRRRHGHLPRRRPHSRLGAGGARHPRRTGASSVTCSAATSGAATTTSCATRNRWRTWITCRSRAPMARASIRPRRAPTPRSASWCARRWSARARSSSPPSRSAGRSRSSIRCTS